MLNQSGVAELPNYILTTVKALHLSTSSWLFFMYPLSCSAGDPGEKGDKGDKGEDGVGIKGSTGAPGAPGEAATLSL